MTEAVRRGAGLGAVAVLWATLGAAAVRGGFPLLGERPLSWMAADPTTSLLFGSGLIVGAVLLVVFHMHLRGRYPAGRGFSLAMLGGLAGQVVTAVVPIDGGTTAYRLHTVAALTLGVSLPVLMWRFAVAQPPGRQRRLAFALLWLELAACAAGIVLSRRSVAPLAEILPAVGFHAWIAAFTLCRPSQPDGRRWRARPSWTLA